MDYNCDSEENYYDGDDVDDWMLTFKPYKNTISEILPGKLYLSDYVAAADISMLQERNITRVISLGGMQDHTMYTVHNNNNNVRTISYHFVYIDDRETEPIHEHFRECIDFIRTGKEDEAVLIHCYAGKSRSATIVIAYLMDQGMNYLQAYDFVEKRRNCIDPNEGFRNRLMDFQYSRYK